MFGEYIHLLAISKKVNGRSKCVISRPNTGTNKNDAYWSDIKRKYVRYADEDMERAQRDWNEEYARGGAAAAKVKRKYTVGVLTGSVTPFWGTLERLMSEFPELGYSQADSQLQVCLSCRQSSIAPWLIYRLIIAASSVLRIHEFGLGVICTLSA